ncbi:acid phosphatase 1-like [Aristolochia californica]|uniref:acid phosphatase 1-like n=1 Tax=Aristolochia californica TaxID=171875 RepID=UPI0035D83007
MVVPRSFLFFPFFLSLTFSQSILQILPLDRTSPHVALPRSDGHGSVRENDELFCSSWKFSIETNDAGIWETIPKRCVKYVQDYCTGDRYAADSDMVADDAYAFASGVEIAGDGRDVWVFDIDETLLSNLPYYADNGFGSELFNETAFDDWAYKGRAPPLPASVKLYKELLRLGFQVILLTGRVENQRNITVDNLLFAGYASWERLILRGTGDLGKPAVSYKSEKRKELVDEGFRIHGNSGDQWSDLLGWPMATRSFKLPNPLYYIA